ncbi:MAG: EAL domain-containing protein [Desulfobacterales bacterium]
MTESKSEKGLPVVLIVDDDESMRFLARASLEEAGFCVEEEADGMAGLAAFKSLLPDVMLLDVMMPGVDGFHVCKKVREMPEALFTPILMITGLGDVESIERAYELGATDFISKPVNWGNLGHHVRYLLRSSRMAEQLRQSEEALRISEERYALAAKGANDGLWDWDLHGGYVYFSDRWQSILGYDDMNVGHTVEDWFAHIHEDDLENVQVTLNTHLEGLTENFEHEHRVRHQKSGDYLWVLVRGIAIRDADGKPYRMAGSLSDITSRKKAEQQLIHNALYDTLTGLANRVLFSNRLSHALQRMNRRNDDKFALLFLDLDRFKLINDSFGHQIGDEILKTVARRLEMCVRPGDTVARLGGDEFVILLESVQDIHEAEKVVERVQTNFKEPIEVERQQSIYTSTSIGLVMGALTYERPEELLRDADTAMFRAKALGRGRHQKFDPSMHYHALAQLQLENDLRRSLKAKEFLIHYQPIISLATGRVTSLEALIRWQHPKKGLLLPDDFIWLAEDTGLIIQIGEWVLYKVCHQIRAWELAGLKDFRVAVNISTRQLVHKEFLNSLVHILHETNINPGKLELEITESVVMENFEIARSVLDRLRQLGVEISLDDFGTGYSSLSYLKNFPVNRLKIDKSFIEQGDSNEENRNLVNAIITLAHNISLDVVAEGVETREQLEWLKKISCQMGQGYLFAKPLNVEDVETFWLQKNTTHGKKVSE